MLITDGDDSSHWGGGGNGEKAETEIIISIMIKYDDKFKHYVLQLTEFGERQH